MTNETQNDPMEFLKNMWGSMGFTLPGMVAPTADTDELSKRIADLKAVEGWLKSNLSLLQMTIHGLEMQRTTLDTLQRMSQAAQPSGEGEGAAGNPFLNPAAWPMPWNLMGEAPKPDAAPVSPPPESPAEVSAGASAGKKSKPKR
jgi:hypothetical protein